MAFRYFNNNPQRKKVGDCVVRAISTVTNQTWHKTHRDLCALSDEMCDMPSSNQVWRTYLESKGFERHKIPNVCPDCYSVIDFCRENPYGKYLVSLGTHVVAIVDGDYLDIWDSGDGTVEAYWRKA